MKKTITLITLALATSAIPVFAQDTPEPSCPTPKNEGNLRAPGGPTRDILESLTPIERDQLMQARKKAIDAPEVVSARQKIEAAHEEFMTVLNAATLKADPTIGMILAKVDAAMKEKRPRPEKNK